jgi:hypothetical protein
VTYTSLLIKPTLLALAFPELLALASSYLLIFVSCPF